MALQDLKAIGLSENNAAFDAPQCNFCSIDDFGFHVAYSTHTTAYRERFSTPRGASRAHKIIKLQGPREARIRKIY
jgi:hypothetical protein